MPIRFAPSHNCCRAGLVAAVFREVFYTTGVKKVNIFYEISIEQKISYIKNGKQCAKAKRLFYIAMA